MELELCENQFLYGVDDEKSDEEIIVVIRKRYTILTLIEEKIKSKTDR